MSLVARCDLTLAYFPAVETARKVVSKQNIGKFRLPIGAPRVVALGGLEVLEVEVRSLMCPGADIDDSGGRAGL